MEEETWRKANFDQLTGLPNRTLFYDRLDQALALAARDNSGVGVLFLDLDRFKAVNDTLGHEAGDELLRRAAERLYRAVRETDTVARLGGDEFVVLLPGVHEETVVSMLADKLLESVGRPFRIGGEVFDVTVSIGSALYPQDGEHLAELLQNADTAMYRAKRRGRAGHCAFALEEE